MPRVPMPPGIVLEGQPTPVCEEYKNDPLYIDINANGVFAASAPSLFDPPLPFGPQPKDKHLGPFTPLQDNVQLLLGFFDTDNGKLYVDLLCVKDDCSNGCT